MSLIIDVSIVLFAYLCGSLATAVIVCKLMGLTDPRENGSNNPGTTNVLRLHGKKAAVLTLLGDVLKGIVPVLIAKWVGVADSVIALTGLAAFSGHLFPVFFGFKGGKGVATLMGVLLATHWIIGLSFVSIWLFIALVFQYSSLAALSASLLTPVVSFFLLPHAYFISQFVMSALLFWRHRSNIHNLIHGKEDKIGSKD